MARQHLTESLRLSWLTGARIGVARGLEAVATLTARDGDPGLAVQLTAAAVALRTAAGLPRAVRGTDPAAARPGAQPGPGRGSARTGQRGLGLTADAAVALVLRPHAGGRPGR